MIRGKSTGPLKPSAPSAGKALRGKKTPICPECGSRETIPVFHTPLSPAKQNLIDIGLRYRLRLEPWYDRFQPLLFSFALLVPVLALLGYIEAGREVLEPAWCLHVR